MLISPFSTYENKIESINQNFATEDKSGKLISLSNQMKVDFLIKSKGVIDQINHQILTFISHLFKNSPVRL